MESSTEDNQIHRTVLEDHTKIIEGIQYHEKLELRRWRGDVQLELSHMRSIGDRTYTANTKIVASGECKDEIETTLAEDEVAAFKKNWEDNNWHPIFGEQSTGIVKTFFKKEIVEISLTNAYHCVPRLHDN